MLLFKFLHRILWLITTIVIIHTGIKLTISLKGAQVTLLPDMFKTLLKKDKNSISSFEAFSLAAGARIGVGSLAGVALAIYWGGPGTIFWMWIVALITASLAFSESTLAQLYKEKNDNFFIGGPAYYMSSAEKNKLKSFLYAGILIFSYPFGFSLIQMNTISRSFYHAFKIPSLITGIIISFVLAFIIFGGAKRIAKISAKMMSFMSILYIGTSLLIILFNIFKMPMVITKIINSALNFKSFGFGLLGTFIIGVQRGIFSNEAGLGTGAIAAATSDNKHPVEAGLVQALSVYFTTLIICTITAFIILLAEINFPPNLELNGIEITQVSFIRYLGPFGSYFIAIIIFFFAFTTIVSGFYYGESNVYYLFDNNPTIINLFKISVIITLVLGTIIRPGLLWMFVDTLIVFMALLNLSSINNLENIVKHTLKNYLLKKETGDKLKYRNKTLKYW